MQREREYDARRRRNEPYRAWYKTRQWLDLRAWRLALEPLCRRCKERGHLVEADTVDHVRPHRGDWELFFDGPGNTQSLCKPCHDRGKQREERRGFAMGVTTDGRPTDKDHPWNVERGAAVVGRRMPADIGRSAIPLVMVCGPPGAGKSTYVRAHAMRGDRIICLDRIMARLSGQAEHQADKRWLAPALEVRNAMLRTLATEATAPCAWFILGADDPIERQQWAERLGARVRLIAPPLAVCEARIRADATRRGHQARMIEAARRWWSCNRDKKIAGGGGG